MRADLTRDAGRAGGPTGVELLAQQVVVGIAAGGTYACMALALVLVRATTGHLNFAQGEMAMFSAFVAWQFTEWGVGYWPAFAASVALAFAGGYAIQRLLIARLPVSNHLPAVTVALALFAVFNGAASVIWGFTPKPFPSAFGTGPPLLGGLLPLREAGVLAVVVAAFIGFHLFLRHTRIGLAMRALVDNPESARLVGIRVGRTAAAGYGLAAAFGAVCGILVAPSLFLSPQMMTGILLYGFAGAVLGGFGSPTGAVLGGFIIGIVENLVSTLSPAIGTDVKVPATLLLIVAVLVLRPQGLFGARDGPRL